MWENRWTTAVHRRSISAETSENEGSPPVQIDIKGRNIPVNDDLRAHVERRLGKISRQVSPLARLEIELFRERNPSIADCQVAEATLYLKGVTLRARDASPEMLHSLNLMVEELSRQVKRHRDKRRRRREARTNASARAPSQPSPGLSATA
jgi:putative sigma-54 modulation protein